MSIACPVCSGSVSPNAPRCDECLVLLEWAAGGPRAKHPFIRPGDPLLFFDLTRVPLPGQVAMARTFSWDLSASLYGALYRKTVASHVGV